MRATTTTTTVILKLTIITTIIIFPDLVFVLHLCYWWRAAPLFHPPTTRNTQRCVAQRTASAPARDASLSRPARLPPIAHVLPVIHFDSEQFNSFFLFSFFSLFLLIWRVVSSRIIFHTQAVVGNCTRRLSHRLSSGPQQGVDTACFFFIIFIIL